MESNIKIQALGQNVVLEPTTIENKTGGGFDFTNITDANEKGMAGVVHSFGEFTGKKPDGSFTLKEGMPVIYNKHNASALTFEGKPYSVIPYGNIFVTL